MMEHIAPRMIRIRYMNVQHWNTDKHTALTTHLTADKPDVVLFSSTSRTKEQGPIKIPFYNNFTTNKRNQPHAGSGTAIKMGIQFKLLNNFELDTIGLEIQTHTGLVNTPYQEVTYNSL